MNIKCPGSQKFRSPEPEIIKCPSCKAEMEIWTDEIQAICPSCKKKMIRSEGPACLDWCRYAKECVGEQIYDRFMQNKAITIKQKLLKDLEVYFGTDAKRINHANMVMNFAEELLREEGGDWHIVIPASILHDVGIKEAEKKYKSADGQYQEKEGPAIARGMLLKLGLKLVEIDEICEIIAHHHSPGKIDTQNFKILYDADCLVNLKEEVTGKDGQQISKRIDEIFLTNSGRETAKKIYLK